MNDTTLVASSSGFNGSLTTFGNIAIVSIILLSSSGGEYSSKAGYNGALSLLMFVPIAKLVAIDTLPLVSGLIYTELNQLRAMRNQQYAPNSVSTNPQYPYKPSVSNKSPNQPSAQRMGL